MKMLTPILTVFFVVITMPFAGLAQSTTADAIVADLYRFCGREKQITDLDPGTLRRYFMSGTVASIMRDGGNLRSAPFDALYVVPKARITGLSVAKPEMLRLLGQETAFVMVDFQANGVKKQIHFILAKESGEWRIRTLRYDPLSVRQYTLTDILAEGARAIPTGPATAEQRSMDATIAGAAASSAGKGSEALSAHTRSIKLAPTSADAYVNRCLEYMRQNRNPEALSDCSKAVTLAPDKWTAYYFRATIYLRSNNSRAALQDLSKVITLEDDISGAFYLRGNIYKEGKQYELAAKDLTRVVDLDFSNFDFTGKKRSDVYFDRGVSYYNLKKYEAAIADMKQATALEPDFPNPYYFLGQSYIHLRNYAEGRRAFDRFVQLRPQDPLGYYGRSRATALMGDLQASVSDISRAIQLRPGEAELYRFRAVIYRELGRSDLADRDEATAAKLKN